MFNFSNINDIEFEYLCKDIMSRMLGVRLQRFAAGRDGGIDLTNDSYKKTIIVQVKHYIKTDVAGLLSSLKNEVNKVRSNNPEKYYICCSKELTPQNKADIYEMFSDYMESTENIISLIEINDFLEEEKNKDILQKHFKLWIESTNILTEIFTKDICIDSDGLLNDIKESEHLFVKTDAYNQAISCLNINNVLIIVGNPGVGKTITSQMIVLYYAAQGYKIRYTTDGSNLSALKRALSQSQDVKEIVLLDDCFGQAYFSMKETQENELLALIKYVKMNSNKILLMNSRVTIYHEATERTPGLVNSFDKKQYKVFILDMTNISTVEKAKIFYNHLYFCGIPSVYRENIRKDMNYKKIIKHVNYNPRIIEFVTGKRQWEAIRPEEYTDFILECLNNPEQIWKNEYERRLHKVDRILLTTLYSLTNTVIPLEVVKKCYNHRIGNIQGIDLSINHFEQAMRRLQGSMIKVVDSKSRKMLSVANPSVNDFLAAHLQENKPERDEIIRSAISVYQLKRMMSDQEYEEHLHQIFEDGSVNKYVFETENQKTGFIVFYCLKNQILRKEYQAFFEAYIQEPCNIDTFDKMKISKKYVFRKLFDKDIVSFYNLSKIIYDMTKLKKIMSGLSLDEAIEFVTWSEKLYENDQRKPYLEVVESVIQNLIEEYCCEVSVDEYDVDIGDIVEDIGWDEYGRRTGYDAAVERVDELVEDKVLGEVYEYISKLPQDVRISKDFMEELVITVLDSSSWVDAYLQEDHSDYVFEAYREGTELENSEIEYIFERSSE